MRLTPDTGFGKSDSFNEAFSRCQEFSSPNGEGRRPHGPPRHPPGPHPAGRRLLGIVTRADVLITSGKLSASGPTGVLPYHGLRGIIPTCGVARHPSA